MKTILYGASDDLVEIDGAIRDEANAYHRKRFEASDGTTGTIEYAPGHDPVWDVRVKKKGTLYSRIVRADEELEPAKHTDPEIVAISGSVPIYSDVLIFNEGLEWIKVGGKTYKSVTP